MSRIGKQPIDIPQNVEIKIEDNFVIVKGPKGELKQQLVKEIELDINEKQVLVKPKNLSKSARALWGTYRSLIANMIDGVINGYEKQLEIQGVGYKANLQGKKLVLNLGYSHTIDMEAPEGIELKVEKNIITISGIDKQVVGQMAAEIRSKRKPEPYKGKGIRYQGEKVRIKAGKKAAGTE